MFLGVVSLKIVVRRFGGDDEFSWACFEANDVKHIKGIIAAEQAVPIISGLNKQMANHHKYVLQERGNKFIKMAV